MLLRPRSMSGDRERALKPSLPLLSAAAHIAAAAAALLAAAALVGVGVLVAVGILAADRERPPQTR